MNGILFLRLLHLLLQPGIHLFQVSAYLLYFSSLLPVLLPLIFLLKCDFLRKTFPGDPV
jgi:hypothetical protein